MKELNYNLKPQAGETVIFLLLSSFSLKEVTDALLTIDKSTGANKLDAFFLKLE